MYHNFTAFAKLKDILNLLFLQKDNKLSLKNKGCKH